MQGLQLKKNIISVNRGSSNLIRSSFFFQECSPNKHRTNRLQMVENNLLLLKGKQNYVVINNCVYLRI